MVALVSILAVAVGLLSLLVAGLLRSHAEILRALQSLGVSLDPDAPEAQSPTGLTSPERTDGAPAVDVAGIDPSGAPVTFAVAGVDHRTLLAFLSSTCLTCRGFWDAFADRRLSVPGRARLLIVTKGSEAESPATIRKLAPSGVHTVLSSAAWADYRIPGAPYFVLLDGSNGDVIGEGAATTWDQVRDLMAQSLDDGRPQDRPSRVNAELRTAGIEPGHPSLHPDRGE
ncbi:MAG TPA: hypothetical protein VHI95_11185 [Acidimicrobiales bacterium]|jgi:hypothetical protein|nr:hypothetical protein [Acidimicrobiales bacterium]